MVHAVDMPIHKEMLGFVIGVKVRYILSAEKKILVVFHAVKKLFLVTMPIITSFLIH